MSVSSPPLSVILVSFQTGAPLFESIGALLRGTLPLELVIVDNGNPAEIVEKLRALAASDRRVRFLSGHGNVGFGRACNMGVAASSGAYILLLNPDCIIHDDTIGKLQQHAAALASPFMIGARILNPDGSDQRGSRRALLTPTTAFIEALHLSRLFPGMRLNLHQEPIPPALTPIPAISGAFMFLPRRDFNLIGGFDESYFLHVEDLDLCFRFRQAGGEIYFAPDVTATHIGGTSEASSDFVERHKTRGFSRYFHNNFKGKYPLIFLWLLDIAIGARYYLRRLSHKRP